MPSRIIHPTDTARLYDACDMSRAQYILRAYIAMRWCPRTRHGM